MAPHDKSPDRWREIRRDMIARQIEARGVFSPRVLSAIEAVPREEFVPPALQESAYEDRALAIGENQTISQPYIVAYMTNALRIERHHKVLEIGTGSGYQAAIIAHLTDRLFTMERISSLSQSAQKRLRRLGISGVRHRVADGAAGWPAEAPFDRIIVTAAAPSPPRALVEQLSFDGRMVIPAGGAEQQTLICLDKRRDRIVERPLIACRFVKFIGEGAWPE